MDIYFKRTQNVIENFYRTYPHNQWRRAAYKENDTNFEESSVTDRTERLGFSTGYGSGSAQVCWIICTFLCEITLHKFGAGLSILRIRCGFLQSISIGFGWSSVRCNYWSRSIANRSQTRRSIRRQLRWKWKLSKWVLLFVTLSQ